MNNNVISLPFEDLAELDKAESQMNIRQLAQSKILELNDWFEEQGVNIETNEFKHQVAGIMAQFQVILMGVK